MFKDLNDGSHVARLWGSLVYMPSIARNLSLRKPRNLYDVILAEALIEHHAA
jgi:hypothetical protein